MPPLVTVLTTVYNRAPYLAACIESVLAQTMDDLELIIVDDCSTDGSYAVAERYLSDPRVRLYRNDTNLGDYPNRNRAASLARGTYLKYVDGDDLIYPHCLELMVEGMETFHAAGYGISQELSGVMAPALLSPRDAYHSHFFETGLFSAGPLDAIFRRDAFEELEGFSPARYTSDTDFFLRIGARWPGVMLVPGLVWWRHHEGQESVEEGSSLERILDVTLRRHRNVCDALDSEYCPLSCREVRDIRRRVATQMLRFSLSLLRRGNFVGAGRTLREAHRGSPVDLRLRCESTNDDCTASLDAELTSHSETSISTSKQLGQVSSAPSRGGTPLFSVTIPIHFGSQALTRAIDSVYAQRFDDWELILIASADAAIDDLLGHRVKDDRVRIVHLVQPLGRWDTYNHAAKYARGSYLKFLEPDEALYPHCLEHAARMMACYPNAALGVSAPCGPFLSGTCLDPLRTIESEFLSTPRFLTGPTGLVCSTAEFIEIGGFQTDNEPPTRNLAIRLASRRPTVLLPDGLVYQRPWRTWYGGAGVYSLGRAAGLLWLKDYLFSDACPLAASQRAGAVQNLRQLAAGEIYSAVCRGSWVKASVVMRDLGVNPFDLRWRSAPWTRASVHFYESVEAIIASATPLESFPTTTSSRGNAIRY
jgi:glycosyltransferase involved in cell wall biosynthesis